MITHNQKPINIQMTHLVDSIWISYQDLVSVFGQPLKGDGDKTQVEWHMQWPDGVVATIYDWKMYGVKPEDIMEWEIGGHGAEASRRVSQKLLLALVRCVRVQGD